MTPKETTILTALTAQKEPVTAETLAEGLEYDVKNLTKALNSMAKNELIIKEGTGKTALFKILDETLDKSTDIGNDFLEEYEEVKKTVSDSFKSEERFTLAQVADDMMTTPTYVKRQCKLKDITIKAKGLTAEEMSKIIPAD